MTVTTLPPATATPATATAKPAKTTAGPKIDADFDTFLKMLTTQLKNQDPLNPMDNSEYAVQLATFSGVEQQVKTNSLLDGLGTKLGVQGMSELAGWVGKQARAEMPVAFQGAPVTVSATPDPQADRAELVATDAAGQVVARTPVALGTGSFAWPGTGPDGAPLANGVYTLALESFAADQRIASTAVESYAPIVEARSRDGATTLVFPGGVEVDAAKVTALRN